MTSVNIELEDRICMEEPFRPFYSIFDHKPILVKQRNDNEGFIFARTPLLGTLLFDNVTSDARDHCANERTFLSWLRLGVYMAVVSVAIVMSFHLKTKPSQAELRVALPFGILFWLLSLACLMSGLANYVRTVMRYSERQAIVQSGWKTELVFTVVAVAIVAACVLFLSTNASSKSKNS
ncbi:hypothetical protein BT63DRAFT_426462 [Microthyrium microscopicum]|uniref:DUF202 domain-containing protein n=1 Tax=Microthyrium microscopicum TaxID=703497 RepID=A0A6A6U923_9PEZI|nr:hypothetical protein BT63DRAFT_426462 [Microthyrium microscopicum]